MSSRVFQFLFLTGWLFATDLTPAQEPVSLEAKQRQRITTIERIAPSVVCVMPPGGQGGGSGVLISADGYAISNYHVTSGSGNFMKCGLNDGNIYDAVIVGIDPTGDVALIKLLGRDDFPFCTPGNSDLVKAGDEVLALGNPFLLASDFSPTVTYCIGSGVHRYQYPANTFLEYTDCIQIDASINPGNSGGPLFDINGLWIGINGRASFEKRGRINSGAAYAISVRQVLLFVDQLKSGRIVDHGRTDFTVITSADGRVEFQEVSQISEAWRRGVRPGDELISFAGRSLQSANDLKNILGIFPAETRVPITFRNRDAVQEKFVRLNPLHGFAEAPQLPEERKSSPPDDPEKEQDPLDPHAEEAIVVPPEYAHLFIEKKGFANFYFNQQRQEQILSPLQQLLGQGSANEKSTWVLQLKHPAAQIETTGELLIGPSAAGLLGDNWPVAHQQLDKLDPSNEPAEYWGLLGGALEWHRLFQSDLSLFSSIVYHGTEELLPSGMKVRVLVIQDDARVARWYFSEDSPLPVGVDTLMSVGSDESRVRFRNWDISGEVPWPRQIGVVDSNSEQATWIEVLKFEVRKSTKAAAIGNQSRNEVAGL